jgi:hypothetical protein
MEGRRARRPLFQRNRGARLLSRQTGNVATPEHSASCVSKILIYFRLRRGCARHARAARCGPSSRACPHPTVVCRQAAPEAGDGPMVQGRPALSQLFKLMMPREARFPEQDPPRIPR